MAKIEYTLEEVSKLRRCIKKLINTKSLVGRDTYKIAKSVVAKLDPVRKDYVPINLSDNEYRFLKSIKNGLRYNAKFRELYG